MASTTAIDIVSNIPNLLRKQTQLHLFLRPNIPLNYLAPPGTNFHYLRTRKLSTVEKISFFLFVLNVSITKFSGMY